MADYRLDRLNTREFEHLSQALCKKFVAVGVTPFGDGPDGGREATFDGKMDYPSKIEPWSGYLVVQCKYRQRSVGDAGSDTEWVTKELSQELEKYESPSARSKSKKDIPRRLPEYYIFVTNAVLTGNAKTGGHDRCAELLKEHATRLGIKGTAIWGFDEIRAFLDLSAEIRQAYLGFILPDDILHRAIESLSIQAPKFESVLSTFLQKELQSDNAAKLESAGQHDEKRLVPLSSVFIDIPFTPNKDRSDKASDSYQTIAKYLIGAGNSIIRYPDAGKGRGVNLGRYAVVGGPGQGKSTIGQYICQIYRAAILKNCDVHDPSSLAIMEGIGPFSDGGSDINPGCLRFPFKIVLNRFASDLSANPFLTIFEYIRIRIEKLGGVSGLPLADLKRWIVGYPWIFILDGLDEVPSSSNRSEVLEAIQHFLVDLSVEKADALVVATTRPQGYADEFAKSHFLHLYLPPLSEKQALTYGSSLLQFRANGDIEKFETTRRRLVLASSGEATMRLMSSPLQVTIMATLVERLGEPPKQRYRLFEEYYRTIYTRESNREGAHSELLRSRKTDIDVIHYRTGLLLQAQTELAGGTDASLPLLKFTNLVRRRLDEHGLEGDDANELIESIKACAVDRLVFLVSPQDDEIGFEIRSLQEFMAAEAIVRGNTQLVRSRIEAIAPITSWRNVFLFMVGKLAAEDNADLLDGIMLMCDELNDPGLHPDYAIIKSGSRLATDILTDGVTRTSPKRERKLCRLALDSLDQFVLSNVRGLSFCYHEKLDDIYRDRLKFFLQDFQSMRAQPAWKLLAALADKGVTWARDMYELLWAKLDISDRARILSDDVNIWEERRLVEILPKLDPWHALPILRDMSDGDGEAPPDFWPDWLIAVRHVFEHTFNYDGDESVAAVPVKISIDGEIYNGAIDQLFFANAVDPAVAVVISEQIPEAGEGWLEFLSIMKFIAKPSKETLAAALRTVQRTTEWAWKRNVLFRIAPWPLGALLDLSANAIESEEIATMAEVGDFGDYDDWLEAERMAQTGAACYDLNGSGPRLSYDRGTIKFNLPLAGANFVAAANERIGIDVWGRIVSNMAESANAAWATRTFATELRRLSMRDEALESDISLPATTVEKFFALMREYNSPEDAKSILVLLRAVSKDYFDPGLLDVLCAGPSIVAQSDIRPILISEMRKAIFKERLSRRAIRWAMWCISSGLAVGLSRNDLDMLEGKESYSDFDLTLLRLGAQDVDEDECRFLIMNICVDRYTDKIDYVIEYLYDAIEKLPDEVKNSLRKFAMDRFYDDAVANNSFSVIDLYGYSVFDVIDERRSTLLSNGTWASLGFSPLPDE
ncbi:hypothetical protein J2785_000609 [Burkholderia ambifaria]|nr:hypothetical protein [Burkholderia ambifaria]MDR6497467.1 hypothetical protein [Burkholderia ambifaria]